jgi:hypothetical protein
MIILVNRKSTWANLGILWLITLAIAAVCLIAFLSNMEAQSFRQVRGATPRAATDNAAPLNGGYIEYWNNMLSTSKGEWENVLNNMRAAHMNTIVLKHLVYKDPQGIEHLFVVPKDAKKSSELGATDPTRLILDYADSTNHPMDVYVGLWEDQAWSDSAFNTDYLKMAKEKNANLIERLSALYGNHPSFKGWYISLEPWNFGNDVTRINILNDFLKTVTSSCKGADKKNGKTRQVAFSIFFNQSLASASDMSMIYGDGVLKNSGVDILMLQDSIIINGWSPDYVPVLKQYFEAGRLASQRNNMQFWAVVENFEPSHHSTGMERLAAQLSAEAEYPSKLVTFDYYHYMNPVASDVPLAPQEERQKLYADYKQRFIKPKSGNARSY